MCQILNECCEVMHDGHVDKEGVLTEQLNVACYMDGMWYGNTIFSHHGGWGAESGNPMLIR